jgi:hypothetical protein
VVSPAVAGPWGRSDPPAPSRRTEGTRRTPSGTRQLAPSAPHASSVASGRDEEIAADAREPDVVEHDGPGGVRSNTSRTRVTWSRSSAGDTRLHSSNGMTYVWSTISERLPKRSLSRPRRR